MKAQALGFVALAGFASARAWAQDGAASTDDAPAAVAAKKSALRNGFRGAFWLAGDIAEPFGGAHSLGDWGYGLGFGLGVGFGRIPLTLGADVLLTRWGSSTRDVAVLLGDRVAGASETRSDQSAFFDAWLRIQPPYWKVRPYVEGVIGAKTFETEYSLAFTGGTGVTSTTKDQATATSVGYGAGVEVQFAEVDQPTHAAVYATLGVRRLGGSRASFARSADASSGNRAIAFDTPTDTTVVMLGLACTWYPLTLETTSSGD